jgi:type I restriction enzyme S subunit
LPQGWAWVRLGDIAIIGTGATPLKSNLSYYENGSIPWVTSAETSRSIVSEPTAYITEKALAETNCTIFPIGTLIVAMYGEGKTRGQISELRIAATTNQACAAISPVVDKTYEVSFIKACFEKNYEDLRLQAKGAQQPNLNLSIVANVNFPLPPLAEQYRIVATIESAFAVIDEIERNKTDLQTAVAAAKSKILSLAIRGKLVPQDPTDEPANILLERIQAERETLVKQGKIKRSKGDSAIVRGDDNSYYEKIGGKTVCIDEQMPFDVPDGWTWARLGDITNIIRGQSPSGDSVTENSNGLEFHQGKIYFSDRYLKHSGQYTAETNKVAVKNSVLLCVRAPVGIVNITDREIVIGRGLCAIAPLADMSVDFLYHWLTAFQNNFIEQATGTTFIAITTDVVRQQFIPIPPIAEQTKLIETVESGFMYLKKIAENLN